MNQRLVPIASSYPALLDDDFVLTLAYEKLQPLLEAKYGCQIDTDLVPKKQFNSVINIFMAHGGKGAEGFRTIYTKHEGGHAIIKEAGIDKLFGNGTIAVVFVCHSASITQEAFAQKLISFSHHILSMGYKAVVAPAWGLHPDIVPIWLEEFLELLNKGNKIDNCVLYPIERLLKKDMTNITVFMLQADGLLCIYMVTRIFDSFSLKQ